MAVALRFAFKSATIATIVMPGAGSFTIAETAAEAPGQDAAKLRREKTYLTNMEERITVEVQDIKTLPALGAAGAATFVGVEATGGATLSGDATLTVAKMTVTGVRRGIGGVTDGSSATIELVVESADGVASGLSWAWPGA